MPCPFCGEATRRGPDLAGPAAHRVGITRAALLAGALSATACEKDPAPPDDVVTVGDVYGVPADGGPNLDADGRPDVVTVGDVYGIPSDRGVNLDADGRPDVVTAGDVYGLPPG